MGRVSPERCQFLIHFNLLVFNVSPYNSGFQFIDIGKLGLGQFFFRTGQDGLKVNFFR